MHSKIVLVSALLVGTFCALGCELAAPGRTSFAEQEWTIYTSPDKLVSFEYPSNLNVTVRPSQGPDDPQLALIMESPDRSIGLTLVVRVLEAPDPGWCQAMMRACLDDNTVATTVCESATRGRAIGLRQEFKSGSGILAGDLVALVLEAETVYVHFTCNYDRMRADELRPLCDRIADSLVVESQATALAAQLQGE